MADTPVNYPSLGNMFGEASAMPGFLGIQQFNQALTQAKQNQAMQSQEMGMKQEMHPLEMLLKQAATRHQNASSDLLGQQTREGAFKNDMNDATKKQQLDALQTKYIREKSEEELKIAEAEINAKLLDPHINQNARSKLMELSTFFKSAREKQAELKAQREQAESVANIQGGYHVQQSRIAADAGIERSRIAAESKKNIAEINEKLKTGKMTRDQAIVEYNRLAAFEKDPEKRELYQALANQMEVSKFTEKREGAAGVPQVDPSKIPGAPLTTPQPPAATPRAGGAPSSTASTVNKQTVEAAGWPYEPDKYDYRVMNGKVQRKPKGQ